MNSEANELLKNSRYLKIKRERYSENEYECEYVYVKIMGPSNSYNFPVRVEAENPVYDMPTVVNLAYPHPDVEICSEEEYLLSL